MAKASGQLQISEGSEEVCFSLNPNESYISGMIFPSKPDCLQWCITVLCDAAKIAPAPKETAEQQEERASLAEFLTHEKCNLEINGLHAPVSSWKQLEAQRFSVDFDASEAYPILPDNSANLYYASEHYVPRRNKICIGERIGVIFQVKWEFEAERFEEDTATTGKLIADLPLREILVCFEDEQSVSLKAAFEYAGRFVQPANLQPAEIWHSRWVRVPLNGLGTKSA